MNHSAELGTAPIGGLLRKQAIPAAIGILTLSINGIIDNIFVGQYIGSLAIAAITVVLPITFLIASIGMSIGVGGASVISRALGSEDEEKAQRTFGNQVLWTVLLSVFFVGVGYVFQEQVLSLFGGKGETLGFAKTYFNVLIPAIPFLAIAMMFNNVIRAQGAPNVAMAVMIIPAIVNIILDFVFILILDWGMYGAGLATMLSYISSAMYALWFFLSGRSDIELHPKHFNLNLPLTKEIFSIGSVTLVRQGMVSLLAIVLNNTLFAYGGEESLSIWGIINRMMMFAGFPVFGVTQGFLPIAGYNYGAKQWSRVKEVIRKSITYGTVIASITFLIIMVFTPQIIGIFISEEEIITKTTPAMRWVFLATPLLTLQLIGAAYYQAIGKAAPAMLLSLTKQGFFLIPLILILPMYLGIFGIWISFPIADTLATLANYLALRVGISKLKSNDTPLPSPTSSTEREITNIEQH